MTKEKLIEDLKIRLGSAIKIANDNLTNDFLTDLEEYYIKGSKFSLETVYNYVKGIK